MKKKVPSHIFPVFGSILSPFILVFCTACASFDSYLETALNFYDAHQTELQVAQVALQEFTDSNECFMWITSTDSLGENYNYNNGYTKKIRRFILYFAGGLSRRNIPEPVRLCFSAVFG
ncbi:MAG: hypothetical protein ACLTCV_04540 [Oscillospiraceae bacterium]